MAEGIGANDRTPICGWPDGRGEAAGSSVFFDDVTESDCYDRYRDKQIAANSPLSTRYPNVAGSSVCRFYIGHEPAVSVRSASIGSAP